jgi:chorismate--pyruvate lyase
MMKISLTRAQWHTHVNAVCAPQRMRHWLTDTMSLTQKLTERCSHFRVQRLAQQNALVLPDEQAAIALPRRAMVQQREVFLRCDEVPVVYAHTVVPLTATTSDWPFFNALGERSLGTTLFGDPCVQRGRLEYARLGIRHPLVLRASAALQQPLATPLFARRCLYQRKRGLLLVTELFLPAIDNVRLCK